MTPPTMINPSGRAKVCPMRIYVPGTTSLLRRLHERGGLTEPPISGSAVTAYLREYYSVADEEELEYLVLGAVAHDSLRLIAANPGEPRRRVVVVIEVADQLVTPDPAAGPTAVQVTAAVPLADIVAVHVDGDAAVAAIEAASAATDAAEIGETGAVELAAAAEDHELLWYGAQEIRDLV